MTINEPIVELELDLDASSPVPLYLQIAERVRRLVALGALREGDRLPPVRDLAVKSRVNRNTAARAIQHLEAEGVVRTRVGRGTFVVDGGPRIDRARRDEAVEQAVDRLVFEAQRLGLPLDDLGWRLSQRIEAFRSQRRQADVSRAPAERREGEDEEPS